MAWIVGSHTAYQSTPTGTTVTFGPITVPTTLDGALMALTAIRTNAATHSQAIRHGTTPLNRFANTGVGSAASEPHLEAHLTGQASGSQSVTVVGTRAWHDLSVLALNLAGVVVGSYGNISSQVLRGSTDYRAQSLSMVSSVAGGLVVAIGMSLQSQTHPGSINTAGWTPIGCGNGGVSSGTAAAWIAAYKQSSLSAENFGVVWTGSAGQKAMMLVELRPAQAGEVTVPDSMYLVDTVQRIVQRTRRN